MKNTPLYVIWNDGLDTGKTIIDEQHRGIIATLNSLHYFIQNGHGLEALKPTVRIMSQYIGFHLKTEEMILEQNQFPNIDKNKVMQKHVISEFNKIAVEAAMCKDPELLLRFIRNWWLDHIKKEHVGYKKYLK